MEYLLGYPNNLGMIWFGNTSSIEGWQMENLSCVSEDMQQWGVDKLLNKQFVLLTFVVRVHLTYTSWCILKHV